MVDEGNLVQAGDANGIVVITQIRPISVLFNLPQQQFPQVNKAFAQGRAARSTRWRPTAAPSSIAASCR